MKILHVVRQFYPSVGGIERSVASLCDWLQRRGHECGVVTLERLWNDPTRLPSTDVVEGVRVERIPFLGGRRYFLAPGVLRFAPGPAVIHIHAIDFFADFLAAMRWRHRRPLVVSTHGGIFHTTWAMPAKRVYFQTVTRLALARAARVICNSARDDRLFAPIVPAWKRVTIGNGVEDWFFEIRKAIDPGLMITVGRIAGHKGIERVIDLLPRIRREVPAARLLVIGPDGDGLRASLEARAAARGLAGAVEFAGAVSAEALRQHLSRAHVVLAASAYEGFGIAVLEAMASASLVVASDIDAHRELIQPGVEGLLVDVRDDARALDGIVRALRLPMERAAAIGARARGAASRFAWDRVADRVERIYHEILAGRNGH